MTIDVRRDGSVAHVFLDRPQKANALDSGVLQDLRFTLEALLGDETLRVVVLGGHGKTFCGGADVDEMSKLDASNAGAFVEKIHHACEAIRRLPVPVVARLHGAVIGAGLEIAAACDLRVAAEGTKFAMPEVRLGIPSVVEAALLPRLMGAGRAAWLVLTGEAIDARRAYEWGLVEEVVADIDRGVEQLLQSLLAAEPQALRAQKALLHLWEEAPLSACIAASIERFSQSYAGGTPGTRMKKLRP